MNFNKLFYWFCQCQIYVYHKPKNLMIFSSVSKNNLFFTKTDLGDTFYKLISITFVSSLNATNNPKFTTDVLPSKSFLKIVVCSTTTYIFPSSELLYWILKYIQQWQNRLERQSTHWRRHIFISLCTWKVRQSSLLYLISLSRNPNLLKRLFPHFTYKEKFQFYTQQTFQRLKPYLKVGSLLGNWATRQANYQLFYFHSIFSIPVKEYNIYVILGQHLNENHIGEWKKQLK